MTKNLFPKSPGHHDQSLLAGFVLVVMVLLAVNAIAQPIDDEAIHVVFKVNGRPVTLSAKVRDDVRDQADKIVRHCGYDGGDQEQQVWRDALAETSSIHLVYAAPIEIKLPRRVISISQAMFSFGDENFLNQPILYHDERTTRVFKCDGMDILMLMCVPELKTYFPPAYQKNCHIIRRK